MSSITPIESLKFTETRSRLSSLVDSVFQRKTRIRIYKGNTPVAAIVSIADLDRLEKYDLERQARFTELERIAQPFADVSPEELEEQVARAIDEVRAERAVAVS